MRLRRYLTTQPAPLRSDPISLPPAILSLIQPHITSQLSSDGQSSSSTTMTAALIQRTRTLQDENDELYELLRVSETGKLKEEVQSLKRVVVRLQRALKGETNYFLCAIYLSSLSLLRITHCYFIPLVSKICYVLCSCHIC